MTQQFKDMRIWGFVTVLLLSGTVLGISAYLANLFLPNIRHDFSIFSLVVPSLQILVFLIILSWSTPRTEAFFLFVLAVLWLTMGAWSSDILGGIQCDAQGSNTIPTKTGTLSERSWCYEMRVVEAFSWMNFCLLTIFFIILLTLANRSRALGRPYAWAEPIVELPWFGQMPGWPEHGAYPQQYAYPAGQPMAGAYPGGMPYAPPMVGGGYVVQQNPGHSVVIQPGSNGHAPTITQYPGTVTSA